MAVLTHILLFSAGILLGMGLMCLLLAGKRIEMRRLGNQLDDNEKNMKGDASQCS
ncbi:MAG: hypothetical protein M0P57_08605 [Syntrophales bacterium]|nr:hypothetical protein [Syntrophales bacterium]MDY0043256.1 hypothetical protein [Syntrophales bacterium]